MMEVSVGIILLGWVAAFVLFAPPRFLSRYRFPSKNSPEVPDSQMRVSCIIPARNEEHRLAPLLASIAEQTYASAQVIVVDDDSSDNTASVARSYGAQVVDATSRPAGWAGKPWACHQGSLAADGEAYIFLDADVVLEKDALSRIIRTLRPGRIVSVQPFHEAPTMIEQLSALFNLQVVASVGLGTAGPQGTQTDATASDRNTEEPPTGFRILPARTIAGRVLRSVRNAMNRAPSGGLFGPLIAVHARDYDAFGGHRRVAGSILEDVHLGRAARSCGIGTETWLGTGIARFRMYPDGFRALVDGWTKNFVAGARTTSAITLVLQVLFISGAATVSVQTAAFLLGTGLLSPFATLISYAAYAGLLATVFPAYGTFGTVAAVLFPLHLLFYFMVSLRALAFHFAGHEVVWRGRTIQSAQKRPAKRPRRMSANRV
ncbi:MAG: glycosyltransferase [Spirochaetales bacterium]